MNPCFFVDEAVVLFNARDPDQPKHERERAAYELARDAGLPVPQVLALDGSLDAAPFSVLVTERLPGQTLEASWEALSQRERDRLADETARTLASSHAIELDDFGESPGVEGSRETSWRARATRLFHEALRAAEEAPPATRASERATGGSWLEREAVTLAAVTSPRLVHRDFHRSNLLQEGGRLSAVLDFEWSLAGDPEADLLASSGFAGVDARGVERARAADRELRPEGEADARWRRLYQAQHDLMVSAVAARSFSAEEARSYKAVSLRQLEAFEGDRPKPCFEEPVSEQRACIPWPGVRRCG